MSQFKRLIGLQPSDQAVLAHEYLRGSVSRLHVENERHLIGINGRAVVDTLSRQCRDNREFLDCRHAFLTLSTEKAYGSSDPPCRDCRDFLDPTVDRQVSVATTALINGQKI